MSEVMEVEGLETPPEEAGPVTEPEGEEAAATEEEEVAGLKE